MKVPMKSIKMMAKSFIKDESGQSTTEYVLLLVFVVMAVKAVGGKLKDGLNDLVGKAFSRAGDAVGSE